MKKKDIEEMIKTLEKDAEIYKKKAKDAEDKIKHFKEFASLLMNGGKAPAPKRKYTRAYTKATMTQLEMGHAYMLDSERGVFQSVKEITVGIRKKFDVKVKHHSINTMLCHNLDVFKRGEKQGTYGLRSWDE